MTYVYLDTTTSEKSDKKQSNGGKRYKVLLLWLDLKLLILKAPYDMARLLVLVVVYHYDYTYIETGVLIEGMQLHISKL